MMKTNYYFIGIKGTGMSSLALILHDLGNYISGCDLDKHFFTENALIEKNIKIDSFENAIIPDNSIVIIGNAFLEDFPLVKEARSNDSVKCYRYHEYLGILMNNYHTICVTGSHGKTTTTGILSSMMSKFDKTGFLIGDGTGKLEKDTKYFCVEADEYRRHFLQYYPKYAIVTNIEIDHVDYFKSEDDYQDAYEEFISQVSDKVLIFGDEENTRKIQNTKNLIWYGLNEDNDLQARNLVETTNDMTFDVYYHNNFLYTFKLNLVGHHLLWNALGVIGIGILENIPMEIIEEGINNFKGVKRRFVVEYFNDNIFIDDYAHHPTEVSITIDAAKKRFPNKKIVAIFKPHRVSRVYRFANEFAIALKKADEVFLCDFTSIDDKEEGIDIDINYLKDMIENSIVVEENEEGAKVIAASSPAVFLFMSSKDIYPLAQLVKRYQNY